MNKMSSQTTMSQKFKSVWNVSMFTFSIEICSYRGRDRVVVWCSSIYAIYIITSKVVSSRTW